MKTLLLNRSEVLGLLDMKGVIEAVEGGYRAFARGETVQPDIVSIELPEFNGEMDLKSGYAENTRLISVKAASGYWDNQKNAGLPNSLSTVMLFDGQTGFPVCIMDGSLITGYRTGAAGAAAAKLLARKDSKVAAVLGAGGQARMQMQALAEVLPIEEIRVWSGAAGELDAYQKEMETKLQVKVTVCASPEEAVKPADVIVTTTPSKEPLIQKEWVRPGTHITAVGADMQGKQELDARLFSGAKVVDDNLEQCIFRGETQNSIREGILRREDIHGEIGQLLLGERTGRENDEEITIFDTTGMAIQDNVTAAEIYRQALEQGIGQFYEFLK